MRTTVRKLGNSAGLIIPKTILAELGLSAGDAVDCVLQDGHLILAPAKQGKRAGWAEASRRIGEVRRGRSRVARIRQRRG